MGARCPLLARGPGVMLRTLLVVMLIVLGLSHRALAAQATLVMEASGLQVGQSATLNLEVVGGAADTDPVVASSPELRVTLLGRTQSIVTRNLQTTRTFVYQYTVTALRAGKATLGPAELRVKGQPVVAQALAMEVREREARAKSALQARASLGEIEEGLKAWVGQTLVYHFSFRHRESLADARWTPPEFPGLSPEPLTQQAQRQYDLLNEGARVTVHDIDIPLVVTSQGSFDVPPGILSAQLLVPSTRRRSRGGFESVFESLGGLAETRSETVASNALRWQARPLPVEGRPEAFAGPVGSFHVEAALAQETLKVGDSTTLTLTIRGDGSLAGTRLPPPPEGAPFRFYDDQPVVTGKVEAGRFEAQAVLKRAIVPLETGVHRVPVPAFASFDPKTERYSVETFDNLLLNVLPGEATAAALSQYGAAGAGPRQEVASLGEDILPIHTAHRLQPVPLTPLGCLESLLVGVPGLSWLGLAFAGRFSRSGRRRRQVATLRARLSRLPADPRERISEIEALYREILGLSLGLPAASVDEDRLREGLRDAPVEEALELYRRIARARYGGQPDPDLHAEVVRYLGKLLGRLS